MSDDPLFDDIRSILSRDDAPSGEIEPVIEAARAESARLATAADTARAALADPMTPNDEIAKCNRTIEAVRLRTERIETALARLNECLEVARLGEKRVAAKRAYAEADAAADALAGTIRERYEAIAAELFALFKAIDEDAARIANANNGTFCLDPQPPWLLTAEMRARGVQSFEDARRVCNPLAKDVRLPAFSPHEQAMGRPLWPPAPKPIDYAPHLAVASANSHLTRKP